MGNKKKLAQAVIDHEGLQPKQTPFRITNPKMAKWTSMFDKSIKTQLDPDAEKYPGTENFLYTKDEKDVLPAVEEWFKRREAENPDMTLEEATKIFDQTGAKGKLKFLKDKGFDGKKKLKDINDEEEDTRSSDIGSGIKTMFKAMTGIK